MNCIRKVPFNFFYNHLTSVMSSCKKKASHVNLLNSARLFASSYEGDGKTKASILNIEQGLGLMILSYSPHGFRLNNRLFVKGSMAIFPNTALSWQIHHIDEITEESLSIFPILEPGIDIVVIGGGDAVNITRERKARIANIMNKYKIPVEILPTDVACTTFNFLVAENRFVGAALIPQEKGYDFAKDKLEKMVDEHGIFS